MTSRPRSRNTPLVTGPTGRVRKTLGQTPSEETSQPARTRRNPHHDAGKRLRYDLRASAPAAHMSLEAKFEPSQRSGERAPIILEKPADYILVVLCEDAWVGAQEDLVDTARKLAGENEAVAYLNLGLKDEKPSGDQIDRIIYPGPGTTLDTAATLAAAEAALRPRLLLMHDTPIAANLARKLAVSLGERPAMHVRQITTAGHALCSGDGGDLEYERPLPRISCLGPTACKPAAKSASLRKAISVMLERTETASYEPSFRSLGLAPSDGRDLPLAEAALVVSAGDGVSDWSAFFEVASALGGAPAGSRAVCDEGYLPRNRQIGASGQLISADCYIAFGISGAPQHLQGIQRCHRVIAVNTDLHAAMVERADLAIIADAQQVMPALTRLLKGSPNV